MPRRSIQLIMGMALLGLLGMHAIAAYPIMIGEHLALMRWLVILVILYAAGSMLRSARAQLPQSALILP